MAIVVDAARAAPLAFSKYNTTYQTGNDYPDTPDATWLTNGVVRVALAETHITARNDVVPWVGIANAADEWVPHVVITTLPSTVATVR